MTSITVNGVKGGLTVDQWAHLAKRMTSTVGDEQVFSGGAVTVSGANFSVSACQCYMPGVTWESTAAETTPIPTNTSSSAKTVYVCAQTDWYDDASNPLAPGTAGSVVAITTAPTRVEGDLWQLPLFRGTLGANSTTVTNLVDLRPTTAARPVAFGGNWAVNANFPLVIRKTGKVRLSGRTARTNNTLAAGDSTTFQIPEGFWPDSIASGFCTTGGDQPDGIASMDWHRLEVYKDGSASFRAGSPIPAGTNVHVDMTWDGA